jgi:tetratricopeptide (TPR) repeat protein
MPSPEQVPAHLLADRQFITACAERKIGTVFHLAKIRAGIYPAQIARLTGLQTSRVTEYIASGRIASSMDVCERVADGLGIPGRMLGLADRPWETRAAPASYQPAVIPETWEILDMLTRSTASDATLLHLEAAVAEAAFKYPVTSPTQSVPLMQRQLTAVHELLSRPQALGARRRCVRILAVLSGLLGLAYHDCGDRSRSDATFHMGQVAAGEAETAELTAWLLTMQSIVDYTAGRTDQAVALLGQADTLAVGASPRRRAWIAANLGRSLAATGARKAALAALDRSAELLELEPAEPIGGLDFFTRPRLDGITGESHALLGHHDVAAGLLTAALERRDQADVKGLALLTFDLAECRIGQGDVDGACSLAHSALDIAGDSIIQPLVVRARAFQASLGPWRAAGPVRELSARVRESEHQLVRT